MIPYIADECRVILQPFTKSRQLFFSLIFFLWDWFQQQSHNLSPSNCLQPNVCIWHETFLTKPKNSVMGFMCLIYKTQVLFFVLCIFICKTQLYSVCFMYLYICKTQVHSVRFMSFLFAKHKYSVCFTYFYLQNTITMCDLCIFIFKQQVLCLFYVFFYFKKTRALCVLCFFIPNTQVLCVFYVF